MLKLSVLPLIGLVLSVTAAGATCPSFTTIANGTTADASLVMSNFNYILQCPDFVGSVGIGTASPGAKLDLENPSGISTTSLQMGAQGTPYGYFTLSRIDPLTGTGYSLFNDGYGIGQFEFASNGPPGSSQIAATITATGGAHPVGVLTLAGNFGAVINGEGTSWFNGGSVGIGTSSPSYTLHVNGSVAGTSAYNNLSDARLKKNVMPIRDALSIIDQLNGVRFAWRSRDERLVGKSFNLPIGSPQVGFIAQDLERVLPEAVTTAAGRDQIKSVQESKVVPVLVEAVKELEAINRNQMAEIRRLRIGVRDGADQQARLSQFERDQSKHRAQEVQESADILALRRELISLRALFRSKEGEAVAVDYAAFAPSTISACNELKCPNKKLEETEENDRPKL